MTCRELAARMDLPGVIGPYLSLVELGDEPLPGHLFTPLAVALGLHIDDLEQCVVNDELARRLSEESKERGTAPSTGNSVLGMAGLLCWVLAAAASTGCTDKVRLDKDISRTPSPLSKTADTVCPGPKFTKEETQKLIVKLKALFKQKLAEFNKRQAESKAGGTTPAHRARE